MFFYLIYRQLGNIYSHHDTTYDHHQILGTCTCKLTFVAWYNMIYQDKPVLQSIVQCNIMNSGPCIALSAGLRWSLMGV